MPYSVLSINGKPVVASYSTNMSAEPRLRSIKFGDGYEQVAPDGINNNPHKFSVAFSKRTLAEASAILTFLEARKGAEPFYWVAPAPFDDLILYRCKKWRYEAVEFNDHQVTADFEEVFVPGHSLDYILDDDGNIIVEGDALVP